MPCMWAKGDPYGITAGRNVAPGHYQTSRPIAGPRSISEWRFLLSTFASNCFRDSFFFCTGVAQMTLPSDTAKLMSFLYFGIFRQGFENVSTARLLPHF